MRETACGADSMSTQRTAMTFGRGRPLDGHGCDSPGPDDIVARTANVDIPLPAPRRLGYCGGLRRGGRVVEGARLLSGYTV